LTLDHYAQVVTDLGALAAEAGKRLIKTAARDNRALEARSGATGTRPRTPQRGPVTRPSLWSRVGEI
jgi:hypothetical protein